MKVTRSAFYVAILIVLSAACDDAHFQPGPLEQINLGEQIAFTENRICSQFAFTHITDGKLIIGIQQPKLIDLDANTVTGIPLNTENLKQNFAQIKATETHLWNIYALGQANHFNERDYHIKKFNISTGVETLLVDSLFHDGYSYLPGQALNEVDIVFNKITMRDASPHFLEGTDSVVYRKNIYNSDMETVVPIKGIPVAFNHEGNLLLYLTKTGYHQYDFVSQQSLYISPPVAAVERALFYAGDEPYVIYDEHRMNEPVYIKSLFDNSEILISDYGAQHLTLARVSPDERYLCYWILRLIEVPDGGYYYPELMLYDFEKQKAEIIFRGEHNRSFDSEHEYCNYSYPDYNADFSPNGKKLTYIFNGELFQFSLGE